MIITMPMTPTEPRRSSTDAASVPSVLDTVPPDTGIKLDTANFAPRIAILSAFEASRVLPPSEQVRIIITNASAVAYHLRIIPLTEPTADFPCPSNTESKDAQRQMQKTGITVLVQKN